VAAQLATSQEGLKVFMRLDKTKRKLENDFNLMHFINERCITAAWNEIHQKNILVSYLQRII
jgi:hypothetical protein